MKSHALGVYATDSIGRCAQASQGKHGVELNIMPRLSG